MMWRWGLAVFLISMQAYGIESNEILKTAWQDEFYLSHLNTIAASTANPIRNVEASFSKETEGTEEFEVGLKFQLKSMPEWRLRNSPKTGDKLLKDFSLTWALKSRYEALLKYELGAQKLVCARSAAEMMKRYRSAQELTLKAGRLTSKSFLKSKNDLLRAERGVRVLEQEIASLEKSLQFWNDSFKPGERVKASLLDYREIEKIVLENEKEDDLALSFKLGKEEIDQLQREIEVVHGRERQWIRSFGISHKTKKQEDVYELQVNIQIPGLGSDEVAIQKRNELVMKRALKKRDLDESRDSLTLLRSRLISLLTFSRDDVSKRVPQSLNSDPLENLETKIEVVSECIEKIDKKIEVYSVYLEYLLESETLAKDPKKNYLFKEGPIT